MRLIILTVGYIHTGKTSFGRQLAQELSQTVCLERDPLAAMLNDHFVAMVEADKKHWDVFGKERLKDKLFNLLLEEAKANDDLNLVLTNCHAYLDYRTKLIQELKTELHDVKIVLVYFDNDIAVLEQRIRTSNKPTNVLTVSQNFTEVLERQKKVFEAPTAAEADYFFTIKNNINTQDVVDQIKALLSSKSN